MNGAKFAECGELHKRKMQLGEKLRDVLTSRYLNCGERLETKNFDIKIDDFRLRAESTSDVSRSEGTNLRICPKDYSRPSVWSGE